MGAGRLLLEQGARPEVRTGAGRRAVEDHRFLGEAAAEAHPAAETAVDQRRRRLGADAAARADGGVTAADAAPGIDFRAGGNLFRGNVQRHGFGMVHHHATVNVIGLTKSLTMPKKFCYHGCGSG